MTFKFLIDECLSPQLVDMAIEAGHPESTCVRNRGWSGTKDHRLMQYLLEEDFTLVTGNSSDFRGQGAASPGGLHAKQALHAGLVCLNSEEPLVLPLQRGLFGMALDILQNDDIDLVNQALDLAHRADGHVDWQLYAIPRSTNPC